VAEAGNWSDDLPQGLIDGIPTVRELMGRIVAEAEELITGRLAGLRHGRRSGTAGTGRSRTPP